MFGHMATNTPSADWDVPRPLEFVRHVVEVAAEHGISTDLILNGSGLSTDQLAVATEVQAGDELTIIRNLIAHRDDALILAREIGMRYNFANTGILGYALLASPTLGDAVTVASRFAALTPTFWTLRRHDLPEAVVIEFDDSAAPPDVRPFLLQRDLMALTRLIPLLVGASEQLLDAHVTLEVRDDDLPTEVVDMMRAMQASVRLSTRLAITMPTPLLDIAMPAADPATAASCVAQCEDLLASRRSRRGVSARVRARLIRDPGDIPALSRIATEFCCAERTLHRRLSAENTSYRALVDEVRETLALALLDSGLTVEETARQLGYSETAAFTRAFQRWRSESPSSRRVRAPIAPEQ